MINLSYEIPVIAKQIKQTDLADMTRSTRGILIRRCKEGKL